MTALIVVGSIGPGFYVWWRVAGTVAWNEGYGGRPDPDDYIMGAAVGMLAFFIWPVFVAWWIIPKPGGDFRNAMYVPRAQRDKLREAQLDERERRIRQLEREAGIAS